jgi:pyruvate,water dikinase
VLAGTATKAALDRTEVVVNIEGRIAIDLHLAGEMHPPSNLLSKLNPIPAARRLRGAWRVGRLRAALPVLAEQLLDRADADLETVPPLETLTSRQLLALLYRSQGVLRSLHAHEILMGLLTEAGCGRLTGASVALRVLSEARRDGLDDAAIRQGSPVVLALTAPAVRPMTDLPVVSPPPDLGQSCDPGSDSGVLREALRLRTRWIQELMGLSAWQLGERLTESGDLPTPSAIRHVPLDDLEAVVTRRASALTARMAEQRPPSGDPLPSRFRVSDRGRPIPSRRLDETGGGTAAGGGVGTGPVTFDATDPPAGTVLVTNTLSPGLGPVLPRLAGLVSDTGSVLSHLAILAREFGVPTVVAYPGATSTFAEHQIITVDGDRGDVTIQGADS